METYTYDIVSKSVCYKGNVFDSLLEFKYAIMIETTHAWLRDGFEIYYGIDRVEQGIQTELKCYRPDFLVRDWKTGQGKLIEIKPDNFDCYSLKRREKIAKRHIQLFDFDWTYHLVRASDITLSSDQLTYYHTILKNQNDYQHQPGQYLFQNNTGLLDEDYRRFVETGFLPAFIG